LTKAYIVWEIMHLVFKDDPDTSAKFLTAHQFIRRILDPALASGLDRTAASLMKSAESAAPGSAEFGISSADPASPAGAIPAAGKTTSGVPGLNDLQKHHTIPTEAVKSISGNVKEEPVSSAGFYVMSTRKLRLIPDLSGGGNMRTELQPAYEFYL